MQRAATAQTADLLTRYYLAEDGEAEIAALIASVRAAVRQRLASRTADADTLEDLCSESLSRLIVATRRSRYAPDQRIDSYLPYALTVADSVFENHLRRVRPDWYRLKRRLIYLLDGSGGVFARWRLQTDWLGGFTRWNGSPFRMTPRYRLLCDTPDLFCREALAGEPAEGMPLPGLLDRLFHWLDTPLEVNTLTTRIAGLQRLQDLPVLAADDGEEATVLQGWTQAQAADMAAAIVDNIAGAHFIQALWQSIFDLPQRQRFALLAALARDELLLLTTPTRLAEALLLSAAEVASLWPTLPLSDRSIAAHLQSTPKQVSNLRKCARERIARRLRKSAEFVERKRDR